MGESARLSCNESWQLWLTIDSGGEYTLTRDSYVVTSYICFAFMQLFSLDIGRRCVHSLVFRTQEACLRLLYYLYQSSSLSILTHLARHDLLSISRVTTRRWSRVLISASSLTLVQHCPVCYLRMRRQIIIVKGE